VCIERSLNWVIALWVIELPNSIEPSFNNIIILGRSQLQLLGTMYIVLSPGYVYSWSEEVGHNKITMNIPKHEIQASELVHG